MYSGAYRAFYVVDLFILADVPSPYPFLLAKRVIQYALTTIYGTISSRYRSGKRTSGNNHCNLSPYFPGTNLESLPPFPWLTCL